MSMSRSQPASQQSQVKLLTEDDIRNFIQDAFNIQVTRESMIHLTPEFAMRIYERFASDLGLVNWKQPVLRAAVGLQNLEQMTEITTITNLANAIDACICGYGEINFCIYDIIAPKRKRTLQILNILIQLWSQYFIELLPEHTNSVEDKLNIPEQKASKNEEISSIRLGIEEMQIALSTFPQDNRKEHEIEEWRNLFESERIKSTESKRAAEENKISYSSVEEEQSGIKLNMRRIELKINECNENYCADPDKIEKVTSENKERYDYLVNERRRLDDSSRASQKQDERSREELKIFGELQAKAETIKVQGERNICSKTKATIEFHKKQIEQKDAEMKQWEPEKCEREIKQLRNSQSTEKATDKAILDSLMESIKSSTSEVKSVQREGQAALLSLEKQFEEQEKKRQKDIELLESYTIKYDRAMAKLRNGVKQSINILKSR